MTLIIVLSSYRKSLLTSGILTYEGMWGNNTAGAMDPNTGIFVAKQGGPYIFTVTGLSHISPSSAFHIFHNGNHVATAWGSAKGHSMMSQTVILDLLPSDKVWVQMLARGIFSDGNNYIHFVGHSL